MDTPKDEVPPPMKFPFHPTQPFDVYVSEPNGRLLVYKKVIFKGAITLLTSNNIPRFLALTQPNGENVYVPASAIVKYCLHGATPSGEVLPTR